MTHHHETADGDRRGPTGRLLAALVAGAVAGLGAAGVWGPGSWGWADEAPAENPPAKAETDDKVASKDAKDAKQGPTPLVKQSSAAADLEAAAEHVRRGDFVTALAKYEELLRVDTDAVMPVGKGRFVSVAEQVQLALGKLPEPALKVYRSTVDGEAKRLLEIGRKEGDLAALMRIVGLYRLSSFGEEAMELAADRLMDRTDFSPAARVLEKRLEVGQIPAPRKAALLTKLAAAYLLSGQPEAARERALKRLEKECADAAITVGSRRVVASAFVANMLGHPPAVALRDGGGIGSVASADRPSWPGNATGTLPMAEVDAVPEPVWRAAFVKPPPGGGEPREGPPKVHEMRLGPGGEVVSESPPASDPKAARDELRRSVRQGFRQQLNESGMAEPEWQRPIPAVSGDAVVVRTSRGLYAVSRSSGKRLWSDKTAPKPAKPQAPAPPPGRPAKPNEGAKPEDAGKPNEGVKPDDSPKPEDAAGADDDDDTGPDVSFERGRLAVTVADGRVFALEKAPPPGADGEPIRPPGGGRGRAGIERESEPFRHAGNRLVCRSLADGRVIWSVGATRPPAGRQPAETETLLATGMYLTAPTHSAGRLYVLIERNESFHAVCLSAADGKPLWTRFVSQKPVGHGGDGGDPDSPLAHAPGSPPALAGGLAYFLTNAGVLAAMDEHSGQVHWVLQYGEPNQPMGEGDGEPQPMRRDPRDGGLPRLLAATVRPPNPVIAAAGRVAFLPADGEELIVVDAATGEPRWSSSRIRPRGKAAEARPDHPAAPAVGAEELVERPSASAPESEARLFLAGPVGGLLILSGPDVAAVRLADGKPAWSAEARVVGRPVASERTVEACVEGRGLMRFSAADGKPRPDFEPPAGSAARECLEQAGLVAVGGLLIAANDSGAAAFAAYPDALRRAETDLAARPGDARMLLNRGRLRLAAGRNDPHRLDEAAEDLQSARWAAERAGERALLAECDAALHRTLARKSDTAGDPSASAELAARAAAHAGPADAAEAGVRSALALSRAGRHREAAAAAQRLMSEGRGGDRPVDPTPPAARLARPLYAAEPLRPARRWAAGFIRDLIAAHGQDVYEGCEAAAAAAVAKAVATGSAEAAERVLEDYPYSRRADECLLTLARLHAGDARLRMAWERLAASAEAHLRRRVRAGPEDDPGPDLSALSPPGSRFLAARAVERADELLRTLVSEPRFAAGPLRLTAMAEGLSLAAEFDRPDAGRWWLARLASVDPSAAVVGTDGVRRTVGRLLEAGRKRFPPAAAGSAAAGPAPGRLPADITPGTFAADRPIRVLSGAASFADPLDPLRPLDALRRTDRPGAGPFAAVRIGGPGSRLVLAEDGSPLQHDGFVFVHGPHGLAMVRPSDGAVRWAVPELRRPPEPAAAPGVAAEGLVRGEVAIGPGGGHPPDCPPVGAAAFGRLAFFDGTATGAAVDLGTGKLLYEPHRLTSPEAAQAANSPRSAAAFSGGLLAWMSQPGGEQRLEGFDLFTGRATPAFHSRGSVQFSEGPNSGMPAPPAPGMPMFASTSSAGVMVYDPLRPTVAVLMDIRAGRWLNIRPAGGGRWVAAFGAAGNDEDFGGAVGFDAQGGRLWTCRAANADDVCEVLLADREWAVIAVNRRVAGPAGPSELLLASMSEGLLRRLATAPPARGNPGDAIGPAFISAVRDGERVYVVTASPVDDASASASAGPAHRRWYRDATLAAYNLSDGKRAWTWKLPLSGGESRGPEGETSETHEAETAQTAISAPLLTEGQVAVFRRRADTGLTFVQVADRRTGKPVPGLEHDDVDGPFRLPPLLTKNESNGNGSAPGLGGGRRYRRAVASAFPLPLGRMFLGESPDGVRVWITPSPAAGGGSDAGSRK